jgi:tRNA-dihydrouridine synthase
MMSQHMNSTEMTASSYLAEMEFFKDISFLLFCADVTDYSKLVHVEMAHASPLIKPSRRKTSAGHMWLLTDL